MIHSTNIAFFFFLRGLWGEGRGRGGGQEGAVLGYFVCLFFKKKTFLLKVTILNFIDTIALIFFEDADTEFSLTVVMPGLFQNNYLFLKSVLTCVFSSHLLTLVLHFHSKNASCYLYFT